MNDSTRMAMWLFILARYINLVLSTGIPMGHPWICHSFTNARYRLIWATVIRVSSETTEKKSCSLKSAFMNCLYLDDGYGEAVSLADDHPVSRYCFSITVFYQRSSFAPATGFAKNAWHPQN